MRKSNPALRTESYIAERAGRANVSKALQVLKRSGAGEPPMNGDEMPKPRRRR